MRKQRRRSSVWYGRHVCSSTNYTHKLDWPIWCLRWQSVKLNALHTGTEGLEYFVCNCANFVTLIDRSQSFVGKYGNIEKYEKFETKPAKLSLGIWNTRREVSVNTRYFLEHLIFREKAYNSCIKSTGLSQKGSFSLSSLQPIKSTHQKKLDIQTFPQTHTIRKHQRSHLWICHLCVQGFQTNGVELGISIIADYIYS